MNNSFEKAPCYLCEKGDDHPVLLKGEPLIKGQFGYTIFPRICKGCGLVYLNPRWNKNMYNELYKEHYDEQYRLENKPDYGIEGVILNMEEIWERIIGSCNDKYLGEIKNVLDVGCGSGYGLKYLKDQIGNIKIYGIESSPLCCRTLQSSEIGAKLVTTDFDSNWIESHLNRFDLIIMRHVLEHSLKPLEALLKLKNVLSPDGIVYIAVPDMMHPRTVLRDYDQWWEYWFRAVHTYYFSKETLFNTLDRVMLYPISFSEINEEVWCVVTSDISYQVCYEKNIYPKQIQVLNRFLP